MYIIGFLLNYFKRPELCGMVILLPYLVIFIVIIELASGRKYPVHPSFSAFFNFVHGTHDLFARKFFHIPDNTRQLFFFFSRSYKVQVVGHDDISMEMKAFMFLAMFKTRSEEHTSELQSPMY